MEPLTLLQFPFSHYNEKARWALDWKGIPHERVDFLPGPHAPQILRLTGKTTTPVLRIGRRVVSGSAEIVAELERLQPEPALHPRDPALRARALEIERHFDLEVGPRLRRALFSVLVREPSYLCRIFAGKRSLPVRALYRALFPVTRRVMGGSMALFDAAAVEDAFRGAREALDDVAKRIGPSGQLVGESFSIADLMAAANFALLVQVPHPDMDRPTPIPDAVQAFLASFESHPAIAWTLEQYRRHRPKR